MTANQTLSLSVNLPASGPLFQTGTYTVTLSASLDRQWSVADASITLV